MVNKPNNNNYYGSQDIDYKNIVFVKEQITKHDTPWRVLQHGQRKISKNRTIWYTDLIRDKHFIGESQTISVYETKAIELAASDLWDNKQLITPQQLADKIDQWIVAGMLKFSPLSTNKNIVFEITDSKIST